MEIREQRHGAVTVLRPVGPLVAADAAAFSERLETSLRASLGRFALDLSAIPFIDSAGLEALLSAADAVADTGRVLKLCGVTDTVREVMDVTALTSAFEFYEDVDSAARSLL
jgi:anti-anti-sigma factor